MIKGVYSYNECFGEIFRKKCRFFSFESCPYLSDSSLKYYKLTNVLVISGPTLSGKTLLISHIIYDLLNTKDSNGKIVFLDTELGFDFETLKRKIESENNGPNYEKKLNSLLSNFLYLPVRNCHEFMVILKSLEICLINKSLSIHSILLDSVSNISRSYFLNNKSNKSNNGSKKEMSYVMELCRKYSIFLIYTINVRSNSNLRSFFVDLKSFKKCKPEEIEVKIEDNSETTPHNSSHSLGKFYQGKDDSYYIYSAVNDVLLSFGTNNSNEFKQDFQIENSFNSDYNKVKVSDNSLEEDISIRIKSSIPDNWLSNDYDEYLNNEMSLFLSFSRNSGNNYITFISKDYRKNDEKFYLTSKNNLSQTSAKGNIGYMVTSENGKSSQKIECDESQGDIQLSFKGSSDNLSFESPIGSELDSELGVDTLYNHDFRVYRIDSPIIYTKCSYEFSNFD